MTRPNVTIEPAPALEIGAGSGSSSERGFGGRTWQIIRNDRLAIVAGIVLVLVFLVAIFAPLLSPYPPNEPHIAARLKPPGTPGYLLGTDGQGRDMLSRLIYGTRTSLAVGIIPVTAGGLVGLILGSVAGFFGRLGEWSIMRLLDVFFGLPPALIGILITACLGPALLNMIVAITVVVIPPLARVAYQNVLALKELPFIEAARASGASRREILIAHIVPNALPPVLVYATALSGLMIVFGAGLSFVGLGVQPPTADWGRMINDGRIVLPIAPHVATLPGIAIFAVASCFSILGDALRDILDPRAKVGEVLP